MGIACDYALNAGALKGSAGNIAGKQDNNCGMQGTVGEVMSWVSQNKDKIRGALVTR